ncbi:MAG: hypothetical protein ABI867_17205 [Kofleriaceae bacterium]
MRSALLVVLLGCGGSQPRVAVPADPIQRESTIEYTMVPAEDGRAAQREAILQQLEAVDRELDAIDDELAASAIAGPATRDDAITAATTRLAALQRTSLELVLEDTPILLVRAAKVYFTARGHELELAKELGERHPERIEQRRVLAQLRVAFERQRDVEIAEATLLRDELGRIPKAAPATRIRQANRRTLQLVLARALADGVVPSDAPVEVRIVASRLAALTIRIETASRAYGPKHPEMIAMQAELGAIRDALRDAVTTADAALTREIAELDIRKAVPAVDPTRLSRRAELAARARDLRREWDALR